MASVAAASSAKDRLRACDYPEAGGKVQYTIPSFPVFTTSLVEIKYQLALLFLIVILETVLN